MVAPLRRSPQDWAAGAQSRRPEPMLDLLFLALTAGFFAAAVAYVHACDRL
ncbi:hypothetical protein [Azospirillum largimobile]